MNTVYTHTPIAGIKLNRRLPDGYSLVLEGGGTRGFYSAGVFEAFMDTGILFPYIIGVSAGAANAVTYIAGQRKRNRQIVEHYVGSPRYVSKRNLLLHHSMFNMDFIFHTIPRQHVPVDWESFRNQDCRFLTGAMNCKTGRTVWFEKEAINDTFEATIASCSIPVLSPVIHYKGYDLLDGGVTDPIPVEKSIADGNRFHVIVLTKNAGYVKEPFGHSRFLHLFYRNYPEVAEAIRRRHEVYNRQLALCEQLARSGQAIIIRPQKPLQVGRTGADTKALLELYDEGHEEALEQIGQIIKGLQ